MSNPTIVLNILILIICTSCKSTMSTPRDYKGIQLVFGKGGGITGEVVAYHLFENGIVFKSQGLAEKAYDKFGKISPEMTTQIFDNYHTLNLEGISFTHPGNIYYFIEWKKGNASHKITWGDSEHKVHKNATLCYNLLNHQISNLKI